MRQDLADLAVDAAFEGVGVSARWLPVTGDPKACLAIVKSPDEPLEVGSARLTLATSVVDVRVNEVTRPVKKDLFEIDGALWRVVGDPRREDPLRRIWSCVVEPAGDAP